MRLRINPLSALSALASTPELRGDATLFVEEPYGSFGAMNPTRHAAIYLSRACAATPTFLRRCEEGELEVVISRYSLITQRDWIAIPQAWSAWIAGSRGLSFQKASWLR